MALEPIIRLGDKTTHGGTVLEGFANYSIYDIPASGLGHKVVCPLCKGVFPIVECISSYTIDGVGVSVQGMKTGCGASLIASQSTALLEFTRGGSGGSSSASSSSRSAANAAAQQAQNATGPYDEQIMICDEDDNALINLPFTVKLQTGELIQGYTDEEGKTDRYFTDDEQIIEVYVGHVTEDEDA